MDQRRPAPGGGDPAVMAEYFETMRQFLETQERVMAAYMTGDAAGIARALPRQRSATVLPRYAEAPVAVVPATPAPAASAVPPASASGATPQAVAPAPALNGSNGASHTNGSGLGPVVNGADGSQTLAVPAMQRRDASPPRPRTRRPQPC